MTAMLLSFAIAAAGIVLPGGLTDRAYASVTDAQLEAMVTEAKAAAEKAGASVATGSDSWTVALYLCGSDLEMKDGFGTDDLMEMLDADIPSNLNMIVMTGGSGYYNKGWNPEKREHSGYVQPTINEYWHVTDKEMVKLYEHDEYLYMNYPDNAEDFFKFAAAYAPADHMMVEFWDHGGGPLEGAEFTLDENGEDLGYMSLEGIDAAVAKANAFRKARTGQNKFDIVGFDCCLMGSVEIAHAMSDSAGYMIASEEVEPGDGWNYFWLEVFGESGFAGKSAAEQSEYVGRRIVDTYSDPDSPRDLNQAIAKWQGRDEDFDNNTLALYDLSRMDPVLTAMGSFGKAMRAVYDNRNSVPEGKDAYLKALKTASQVGYLHDGSEGQVDIYKMAKALADAGVSADLTTACGSLIAAVGEGTDNGGQVGQVGPPANASQNPMVIYRGLAYEHAGGAGLAIFFPSNLDVGKTILSKVSRSARDHGGDGSGFDDLPITQDPGMEDYASFIRSVAYRSDIVKENVLQAGVDEMNNVFMKIADSAFTAEDFVEVTADVSAVSQTRQDYYLGSVIADYNQKTSRYEIPSAVKFRWLTIDGTPVTAKRGNTHVDYYLPAVVGENTRTLYKKGDKVPESEICTVHLVYYPEDNISYLVDWCDPHKHQDYDLLHKNKGEVFVFNPVRRVMNENGTPGDYIANTIVTAKAGQLEKNMVVCQVGNVKREIPPADSGYVLNYSFTGYDMDLSAYTSNSVATDPKGPITTEPVKGTLFKAGGNTYKVLSLRDANAVLTKARNASTVTVPEVVVCGDYRFKVTGIASGAFSRSKAKTVIVKTTWFTKKSVKGALKKSKVKNVKVKTGSVKSTNRLIAKKYKKYFSKKNAGRKVTVK